MDPIFKLPASPGTPLFPVSPERANRQQLPPSPSLPSDLQDPFRTAHLRESSDVQNKVAQFNNLSKEAAQRRRDNEAAMRRAVLGREEAESETRRIKDENRVLRKEIDEGKAREKRVAQRLEDVLVLFLLQLWIVADLMQEELHKTKESHGRSHALYEKEIRRARKEAFKSSSALVKMQEELKTARNRYTLMREEVEVQKRKVDSAEKEAFSMHYQLVGLQEETENLKLQIKVLGEERDALKTNSKEEELARIAAEGKIALPPSRDEDDPVSPKKRRRPNRESLKENRNPDELDMEIEDEEIDQINALKEELRIEKRLRSKADAQIDFMKMECQFGCCSCRLAERKGTVYVHDGSLEAEMEQIAKQIPHKCPTQEPSNVVGIADSIPPDLQETSHCYPSSPIHASSLVGQDTANLINFSPSTATFHQLPSPVRKALPELFPPEPQIFEDSTAMPRAQTPITASPNRFLLEPLSPRAEPEKPKEPAPSTSRPLPSLPSQAIQSTIRSVTCPGTTTTTMVPLAPSVPFTPNRTMSRDEALEQIRQRRGRAKSIAAANRTPRKVKVEVGERRDLSAPAGR
ncbi:MAG: hypothetical protein LQ342_003197 [Letrouitia transgressa]|nr:MAG: hypothetical protein LQ342_003197 [Letrouitia transgressa]